MCGNFNQLRLPPISFTRSGCFRSVNPLRVPWPQAGFGSSYKTALMAFISRTGFRLWTCRLKGSSGGWQCPPFTVSYILKRTFSFIWVAAVCAVRIDTARTFIESIFLPVLADQGMYFTGFHLKLTLSRALTPKYLRDVPHFRDRSQFPHPPVSLFCCLSVMIQEKSTTK